MVIRSAQDVLWLRNRAIDSTNVSVVITDAASTDVPVIDVNPAFVRLTGYLLEDIVGLNCRILQGPRTSPTTTAAIGDAIRQPREIKTIILNYRKNGSPFWNELNISPVYDVDDRLTHFVSAQTDASDLVRGNLFRQLLNDVDTVLSDQRGDSVALDSIADLVVRDTISDVCAIHLIGDDGQLELKAWQTSSTISGHSQLEASMLREMPKDAVPEYVRACVESGTRMSVLFGEDTEAVAQRRSDARFGIVVAPLTANSRIFGSISFAVDVDIRQIDATDENVVSEIARRIGSVLEMRRLYAELRTAVEVRDEFLSIAAHELRTPISSIKGYSQLLLRGLDRGALMPERLRLGLNTIESSSSRLTILTNDLLEVSRAGKTRLPLHLERISAYDYVHAFLMERRTLKPDEHSFVLKSGNPDLWIDADIGRLDQIMSNLSSNAVKYSPQLKPVELSVIAEADGVTIEMRDFGMGLDADDLETIFQPYQRASSATDSNIPGMGLGLFISRNIAEQHNGTLTANSDGPDTGTTFKLWIPASKHGPVSNLSET